MDALVLIGDWIASRRKALDLTQRDLASQTACSPATIKKIEMGARRPSRELALLLAAALQVPEGKVQAFADCARGLRAVDALTSPKSIHDVLLQESAQRSSPPEPLIQLPAPSTPFIGREAELTAIAQYLGDPTCRLLTLVGPGGIGKTRLAYQGASATANRFPSGVHGVPLAGVSTIDEAPAAIADRLMLPAISGDAKKDLFNYLRNKRLLLILDNLEHLQDGAQIVAEILAAAPEVKILATSRERLNLSGEWLFPVRGLSFPTDAHQATATF